VEMWGLRISRRNPGTPPPEWLREYISMSDAWTAWRYR
jgi:hypothetical protein